MDVVDFSPDWESALIGTQPKDSVSIDETESVLSFSGTMDEIHHQPQNLFVRLIFVLQAQLGSKECWAWLKTQDSGTPCEYISLFIRSGELPDRKSH